MNFKELAVYGGIAYLAYMAFFKRKAPATGEKIALDQPLLSTSPENVIGTDGKFYFRYAGSSALRVDPASGQPINCGKGGDPFTSRGIEGHFAKQGVAPTTYYAVLQLGSQQAVMEGSHQPNANLTVGKGNILNVGDKIVLTVTGGQFSALDNQVVTVLQLGTDACTQTGAPEMMNSAVVVDVPIILEGAGDYQYPAQQAIGFAQRI
jgi:hypothetical protein